MNKVTLTEKLYNRAEVLLLNLVPTGSVGPLFKWLFKIPILQYRLGLGWMIEGYLLLLTTTGRRSGKERHTPLEYGYDRETGRYRIAAGWGGRTDWCRNILADPHVKVQVGRRTFKFFCHCEEGVLPDEAISRLKLPVINPGNWRLLRGA